MRKPLFNWLAGALLGLAALGVQAQTWPTQPVRIIVPFTAGTGMDTIARAVGPRLSERLGQPVIIINQPGASGNIGANAVARATDGHTVLKTANTMLIAAQVHENVPFDPVRDFAPVSLAAWGTLMLVANPRTGIDTLDALMRAARANPRAINFGSPGVGTPHHMAMELFKIRTGLSMLHVPYRGSAPYIADLLGGVINVGFLPVHIAQAHVAAGRLNALAVGSPRRHPVAPNVATFGELGIKDVEVDLWYAFFVPAATPAPVVSRLNAEIAAIVRSAEVRDLLGRAGMDAEASTTAELGALVAKDFQRWCEVIRRNNIRAE